jgi:xylitol oxidase
MQIFKWYSISKSMDENSHLKNWAGNLQYSAKKVYYPESVEEVQNIVKNCDHIIAIGTRYSFNEISDNTENQISLERLNKIISLDKDAMTVTIEAGVRYVDLGPYLHSQGYALHNMASFAHLSIIGACSTAAHGSGLTSGNLATAVCAIEFVDAEGNLVTLSKQKDPEFYGAVVALGALGIVTKLTLKVEPTFQMKQVVYKNLPMSLLKDNFNDLESKGYSVSLLTNWGNKNINQVWIKSKVKDGEVVSKEPDLYGIPPASEKTHPVDGRSADVINEQLGIPGPWFERMPHFKNEFEPGVGSELQSEYYVSIEHAYDAMMALEELHEKVSPHLYVSEIRTIASDELWMSPCYKRTCVGIHNTWKQDPEVMDLLPLIEKKLEPFKPVPHWGKLFTMSPTVIQSRFEKLEDFKRLVAKYDPNGKFRNDFINKNFYSAV